MPAEHRKTVIINAISLNLGGGRSIRDSYLRVLNEDRLNERYVVFVAKGTTPAGIDNPMIEILELPSLYSKTIIVPFAHRHILRHYFKRYCADVVLNFSDVILRTDVKQIYVFDNAYLLDVDPGVFLGMEPYLRLSVWAKRLVHRLWLHEPAVVVAQTELAREALIKKYGLADVRIIGNAVTVEAPSIISGHDYTLPDGIRLLYPATYYPHKNHEVLLKVAEAIKARKLDYRIVTTIAAESVGARRFLAKIMERGLGSVIVNLGHVPLPQMPDLYRQCQGMLMPTLLESFSISYPEAMHHHLPIFTSDLDFARAVCGEAARYFDPLDADEILRSIEDVFTDAERKHALVEAGARRLKDILGWPEVYAAYQSLIHEQLYGPSRAAHPHPAPASRG